MKLWRPSLRVKLTFWFLVTFSTVFAGFLASAWWLYRESSHRAIDERLVGIAEGIASQLRDTSEPAADLSHGDLRTLQSRDRRFSLLAVRDDSGRILASQWSVDVSVLPPVPASEANSNIEFHSLSGDISEALVGQPINSRLITYSFARDDGEKLIIDVAQTTDIEAAEQIFAKNLVIIGAVGALIASTIAAWIIAGRAVAPLQQLAEAARSVNPQHFDTRLRIESSEREVSRLQSELNDALSRLEEGYRAQERFISHVAHDLKTPIAVMLSQSEVLNIKDASVEELTAYRRSLIEEMRRLGRLVEGFLTLARADQAEALTRQSVVQVNDLIMDSVSHCGNFASQLEVILIPNLIDPEARDSIAEVEGDPDLLRTMFDNLLRNAIQHSPAHKHVEIDASIDDHHAVVAIRDHGPGIPEDFLDKIFDRFVQAPGTPRRADGSGLGLAIAKRVATIHGGEIEVRNGSSAGCTFSVRLPLYGHKSGSPPAETPAPDELTIDA